RAMKPNLSPCSQNRTRTPLDGVEKGANSSSRRPGMGSLLSDAEIPRFESGSRCCRCNQARADRRESERNAGKEGNGRVFSRFAGGLGRAGPLSIVRRADFGRAGRNQRPKQLQPATGRLVPEAARGRSKGPAF